MVARYAVMGNPVAHSLSPVIHQLFAEQTGRRLTYEKILIDLPRFEDQVRDFFNQGGKGLNITLPCKLRAFAMSEAPSLRCVEAKAANTLWMEEGSLHADNTDGVGLLRDLSRYIDLTAKSILVVGAGGAARGILGPLLQANPAQLTLTNRTLEKAKALQRDFPAINCCALADLSERETVDLVINATSASLDDQPLTLPEAIMLMKPLCYDLAYKNNGTTPFVHYARKFGAVAVDGLGMLVEQAAEAFFIWHRVMPDTQLIIPLLP